MPDERVGIEEIPLVGGSFEVPSGSRGKLSTLVGEHEFGQWQPAMIDRIDIDFPPRHRARAVRQRATHHLAPARAADLDAAQRHPVAGYQGGAQNSSDRVFYFRDSLW